MTSSRKPLNADQLKSVTGGSYVTAHPDKIPAAAKDLEGIASALSAQMQAAAAAAPTVAAAPAATDEISAAVAAQFTSYAQLFQSVSAQAGAVDGSALAADATDGITAASPANLAGVGGGGSVVVKAPEAVTSAAAGLQELGGALSAQATADPKTDK